MSKLNVDQKTIKDLFQDKKADFLIPDYFAKQIEKRTEVLIVPTVPFGIATHHVECSGTIDIGFDEYFNKNGVCLIEWSDIIKDYLPEERLEINFKVINENTRILEIVPYGEKYEELCNSVL